MFQCIFQDVIVLPCLYLLTCMQRFPCISQLYFSIVCEHNNYVVIRFSASLQPAWTVTLHCLLALIWLANGQPLENAAVLIVTHYF